jgi:hypothetical protein
MDLLKSQIERDPTLSNMSTDELLRYADRSDPLVRVLAERLERVLEYVDSLDD